MFRHSLHDRAGDPAAEAGVSGDAVAWMHLRSAQPDSHDRNRQVQVDGQISSVLVGVGRRSRWVARANCRQVRCSVTAVRAMTADRR